MERHAVKKVEEILHEPDDRGVESLNRVLNSGEAVLDVLVSSALYELAIFVCREERSRQFSEIRLQSAGYARDVRFAFSVSQRVTT